VRSVSSGMGPSAWRCVCVMTKSRQFRHHLVPPVGKVRLASDHRRRSSEYGQRRHRSRNFIPSLASRPPSRSSRSNAPRFPEFPAFGSPAGGCKSLTKYANETAFGGVFRTQRFAQAPNAGPSSQWGQQYFARSQRSIRAPGRLSAASAAAGKRKRRTNDEQQ
jgi:hypothetical protein